MTGTATASRNEARYNARRIGDSPSEIVFDLRAERLLFEVGREVNRLMAVNTIEKKNFAELIT